MENTSTDTIVVTGAEGVTYPVLIGKDLLSTELPALLEARGTAGVAIVTNDTLAPLYGEPLRERLDAWGAYLITLPDGEQHKTLAMVEHIYHELLRHKADRSATVVALGGGVVGDTVGFAAATFMRGVAFVQAPTSLLAMVDASIGGKVGVDLPEGKNLVGAFKDPIAVIADIATLETLPPAELRAGMAEIIKAALIADPDMLALIGPEGNHLTELVRRAVIVKKNIVEADRTETGIRAYLNLGHTFAHALEQVSAYSWRHGDAVAVGLVAAARLSAHLRLCSPDLPEQVESVLAGVGLPLRFRDYSLDALWEAMHRDKKWRQGQSQFVLLSAPGAPTLVRNVPRDPVLTVLSTLREDIL